MVYHQYNLLKNVIYVEDLVDSKLKLDLNLVTAVMEVVIQI